MLLLGFAACTEDDLSDGNRPAGKEIQIIANRPQDGPVTKADIKKNFAVDDIIHISATFTYDGGKANTITYACMKYTNSGWIATDNTSLTWPEKAVSGTFTAYYFPSANALTAGKDNSQALSDLTDTNNPLRATFTATSAGITVYLQFEHLCTKLTLKDLKDNEGNDLAADQELWLTKTALSNSYVLRREMSGELTFAFTTMADKENMISTKSLPDGTAVFFLEEGDYQDMKLTFRNYKPYLTFNIAELSKLEHGKHYTLSITNLPGTVVSSGLKEEQYWGDTAEEGYITIKDINAFLAAIKVGNKQFIQDGVLILDVINNGTSTVTQLRNVSFGNAAFTPVDVSSSIVFDGNYRTIKDVKITNVNGGNAAIFGKYEGTIMNLALENVTTAKDLSATNIGALIGDGAAAATLNNIKLKGVNKIEVSTSGDAKIGGLVGTFSGTSSTAKDIEISGELIVRVSGSTNGNVYVGGLAGDNSGTINLSVLNCTKATVINECQGAGTLYTGGLVGYSLTKLDGCTTMTDVDASSATANITYTGGLAGRADKAVVNCDASGTVKGGTSASATNVPGMSFTGGSIGEYTGTTGSDIINNCQSFGPVTSGSATGDAALTVTGGLIGHILLTGTNSAEIRNCGSVGSVTGTGTIGGLIGKGEKEGVVSGAITLNNSFSMAATNLVGDNTKISVTNCHYNGTYIGTGGGTTTLDKLNTGRTHSDWFEWTSNLSLFAGKPYLIRK